MPTTNNIPFTLRTHSITFRVFGPGEELTPDDWLIHQSRGAATNLVVRGSAVPESDLPTPRAIKDLLIPKWMI